MNGAQVEPQPIEFREAITLTESKRRYLLLGNGFSINARPSFAYPSLFRQAGLFSQDVSQLFAYHQTNDFEHVLGVLKDRLSDEAASETKRADWRRQEEEVRAGFIRSLSSVHPDSSHSMAPDERDKCVGFLEPFVGRKRPQKLLGRVYTTNYDLLLYWALAGSGRRLHCYDAHISRVEKQGIYGEWQEEKNPGLVYLHGALHLYDTRIGQIMLRYRAGHNLIDQTRRRLDEGRFPVIVSEGTSAAKAERISRSRYLDQAQGWFRRGMRDPTGVLFTYGHSLSDRDGHILREIGRGRVSAIYIGAYGGLSGNHEAVTAWAEGWWKARRANPKAPPLAIYVYDTALTSPWR